jgi:magnesium transporter
MPHDSVDDPALAALLALVKQRAPLDAASMLADEPIASIQAILARLRPELAIRLLRHLPQDIAQQISIDAASALNSQWQLNRDYPDGVLGRYMERPQAVYPTEMSAGDAIEDIRKISQEALITYAYVTDHDGKLLGLVVMRDLMLAARDASLQSIMLQNPFYLTPDTTISDAMQASVRRHYPVYPVCDEQRRLLGILQGFVLFEEHAFELSAQSGRMVGVEKEEHLHTPWLTSFKYRHPWLQLNLLTAFLAAFVVGSFEDTISKVVLLAVFLPVLAGQSGNTGGQSLAITLRAMTLNEFKNNSFRHALIKEGLLGLANGALVGVTAAAAMFAYATYSGSHAALTLSFVVLVAMLGSCVVSGISGVMIPVALKKFGADPATASTIFLTTATDVVSMGMFLGVATLLLH